MEHQPGSVRHPCPCGATGFDLGSEPAALDLTSLASPCLNPRHSAPGARVGPPRVRRWTALPRGRLGVSHWERQRPTLESNRQSRGIWGGCRYSRQLYAEVLQRLRNFPGGIEVAKRVLQQPVLRPIKSKEAGKTYLKPTSLRTVVRRALPRFNARLSKVGVKAFMESAYRVYGIDTRVRVNGRDNVLVLSPADHKNCLVLHWNMAEVLVRVCMLATSHAVIAKIKGLSTIYVAETQTETAHSRVRREFYANVVAKVCPPIVTSPLLC